MSPEIVNTITQLVNGVGFPIAACIAMAWFIVWNKKQSAENKKYNFTVLNEAIANNTKVVEKLAELIERGNKS